MSTKTNGSFGPTISRRVAAASAAAAPFVFGSRSWAQAPSKQLTLGIIGTGKRTHVLLNSWAKNPRLRVVALADVDQNRLDATKAKYDKIYGNSDITTTKNYKDLLARKDIDAVAILTPDHWHAIQVIDAANAGKHIYCEKPLTHTIHESKMIVEAVKKTGVVFQTGSQQRVDFGQRFMRAAEYVRNGMIGECTTAYGVVEKAPARSCTLPVQEMEPGLDWEDWQGPAMPRRGYNDQLAPRGVPSFYPKWRFYHEYAGGNLADFGAHHFDIIQWAFDKDHTSPTKIIPPASRRNAFGAKAVYEDGKTIVHGNFVEGSKMKGNSGAVFVGTKGRIEVGRGHIWSDVPGLLESRPPKNGFNIPRHRSHLDMFIDCCFSGKESLAHVEAGARTATICHLMLIAYYTGKELNFDPKAWDFGNDTEANKWLELEKHPDYQLPAIG